jgi:hypothetical protein
MVLGGRLPGRVGHCQGIIPFCIAIIQFEFKNKPVLEGLFLFIEKVEIFSAPASNKFSIQEKIKNIVGRIGSFHGSQCPRMEFLALVRGDVHSTVDKKLLLVLREWFSNHRLQSLLM